MRQFTEDLSSEDRRVYWTWLGSLFAFYGALLVVTFGVLAGHQGTSNLADEAAMAQAFGKKLPAAGDAPAPVRHAAKK